MTQIVLGHTFQLTDLLAAFGLGKTGGIDYYLARRLKLNRGNDELVAPLPITPLSRQPTGFPNLSPNIIFLKSSARKMQHCSALRRLREQGVGVGLHDTLVHTKPCYEHFEYLRGDFPNNIRDYGDAISLSMYVTVTAAERDDMPRALEEAL